MQVYVYFQEFAVSFQRGSKLQQVKETSFRTYALLLYFGCFSSVLFHFLYGRRKKRLLFTHIPEMGGGSSNPPPANPPPAKKPYLQRGRGGGLRTCQKN